MSSEKTFRLACAAATLFFVAAGIARPAADYLAFHQVASASTLQDLSGLGLLLGLVFWFLATRQQPPRKRTRIAPLWAALVGAVALVALVVAIGSGLHWILGRLVGEDRLWFQMAVHSLYLLPAFPALWMCIRGPAPAKG